MFGRCATPTLATRAREAEIRNRAESKGRGRADAGSLGQLSQGALAIAFIGLIEALSIAKAIAHQSQQKIDYNRQILAEGPANLTDGFFQALPGSGSLSRSAINFQAGAATRFCGIVAAATVAVALLLFAPLLHDVPTAALAGLLIVTAVRLVDVQRLLTTVIYDLEGELFFGAAPELDRYFDALRARIHSDGIQFVILRLKRVRDPDAVCIERFEHFLREEDGREVNGRRVTILLAGVRPDTLKVLRNIGFDDWFPAEQVFPEEDRATLGTDGSGSTRAEPDRDRSQDPLYYLV